MSDVHDMAAAAGMLADPSTTAEDLYVIAQMYPTLRTMVAVHSNAYPGLLDWLGALGDPAVSAAVASRRATGTTTVPPPSFPSPAVLQQVPYTAPAQEPVLVPRRNGLLFVSSILLIVTAAFDAFFGIVFFGWLISKVLFLVTAVCMAVLGILGGKNSANRAMAGSLVTSGIGVIILQVTALGSLFFASI